MDKPLEEIMKRNSKNKEYSPLLITRLSEERRKQINEKLSKVPPEYRERIDRWARLQVKQFTDIGFPIDEQAKIYHEFILNGIERYFASKRKF